MKVSKEAFIFYESIYQVCSIYYRKPKTNKL